MIYIVGIGVGNDIEDLTLKAYNVIKKVDIGIYIGEMIGNSIIRLFDNKLFYYGRDINKQSVHKIIKDAVVKNKSVALLMPGDISFFSGQISEQYTFDEYVKWFRSDNIDFDVISGVSAMNALCAKASIDLTALSKTQNTFITSIEREKDLNRFDVNSFKKSLSTKPNIILYQSYREWEFIKKQLLFYYNSKTRIVFAYKLSWSDEIIINTTLENVDKDIFNKELDKHTIIFILP